MAVSVSIPLFHDHNKFDIIFLSLLLLLLLRLVYLAFNTSPIVIDAFDSVDR
jgi:hypothetical protein